MQPALVIMAAGMGSRYGGLKQLDAIGPNGEKIIDYTVFDAAQAGFGKAVFIIREELRDLFDELIANRIRSHFPVEYVYQDMQRLPGGKSIDKREKPWGTGHAVWCCKDTVREPFAVVNADDYYGPGVFQRIAEFLMQQQAISSPAHYCMAGYLLANTLTEHGTVARGICQVENGLLKSITEHTQIERQQTTAVSHMDNGTDCTLPLNSIVSMNCWGFTPDFFDHLERELAYFLQDPSKDLTRDEFYLPAVASKCVEDGVADVTVLQTPDQWYGVTYQEDKPAVTAAIHHLAQTIYPPQLWD